MIYLLLFLPKAWWCCSLRSSSRIVRIMFFSCLSISNRSVVPSFQVLPILSSFASLLNRSAVWNLSYPLCHFFNSSGGSVLLISSSILSSYKFMFNSFHLQSECCPNYIIIIHSYLVSTRVVSIPSCPLCSSFMSLQPSSYRNVPRSSFLTDCLQSRSSLLYSFF